MNSIQQDLANKRGDTPVPDALPLTDSAFGEPEKVVNPFGDGKARRLGEPMSQRYSGRATSVMAHVDKLAQPIWRLIIEESDHTHGELVVYQNDLVLRKAFLNRTLVPQKHVPIDYAITYHCEGLHNVVDTFVNNGPSGEELAGYVVDQAMATPVVVTEPTKEPLMLEGHEFVPDWTEAHKTQAQYDAMHAKKDNQPMVDKANLAPIMAAFNRQCDGANVPKSVVLRDAIRHACYTGSWSELPADHNFGGLLMATKTFIESGAWKRLDTDGSYADADAITAGRSPIMDVDENGNPVERPADAPVSHDTANETQQAPTREPGPAVAPDLMIPKGILKMEPETKSAVAFTAVEVNGHILHVTAYAGQTGDDVAAACFALLDGLGKVMNSQRVQSYAAVSDGRDRKLVYKQDGQRVEPKVEQPTPPAASGNSTAQPAGIDKGIAPCALIKVGKTYSGNKAQLQFECDGFERTLNYSRDPLVGILRGVTNPKTGKEFMAGDLADGAKFGGSFAVEWANEPNRDGKVFPNIKTVRNAS